MMTPPSRLLVFPLYLIAVKCLEVEIVDDVSQVAQSRAEVICRVSNIRDYLDTCEFYGPGGRRYRQKHHRADDDDDDDSYDGVEVTVDARRDQCVLAFSHLQGFHNGAWQCVAYDGRSEAAGYAFVRVYKTSAPFQVLRDEGDRQVQVRRGRDARLVCPTNAEVSNANERPICKFYDPTGKVYIIVGSFGQILSHKDEGIEKYGNIDRGECGIQIRDVQYRHSGTWKCEMVRKQRPKSNRIGSEATSANIDLQVYRTSRATGYLQIQGQYEGDRRAAIVVDVDIDPVTEQNVDFFWVVQRNLIVYEDGYECRSEGNRNREYCYEALRRKPLHDNNSSSYEMLLEVDELNRQDIEEPIVLVKSYKKPGSNERYEMIYFAPSKRSKSFDTDNDDDGGESTFEFEKAKTDSNCLFRGDKLTAGERKDMPTLCVQIICQEDGSIDLRSMRQSRCTKRRSAYHGS